MGLVPYLNFVFDEGITFIILFLSIVSNFICRNVNYITEFEMVYIGIHRECSYIFIGVNDSRR